MSMKHPNSDDLENSHPQQSVHDDTIEIEDDMLEQTAKRPVIVVPAASSPTPREAEVVFSNTSDKHNGNEQNHQNSETQKTVLLAELVPFTPEVTHIPTQ